MTASQNDVCITQQKCHIMIFFRGCSMIKDESNKKIQCFLSLFKKYWFSYEGMLIFVSPFCDAAFAKFITMHPVYMFCGTGHPDRLFKGRFFVHCFFCRPSDSTMSVDAGIERRTVVTYALTSRRSNHSSRSHPHSARSHPRSARSHPHLTRSHPHSARSHSHSARSHPLSARSHPNSADHIQTRLDLIHV